MKKLLTGIIGLFTVVGLSGCFGTLLSAVTHGKSTVSLMGAPKDIQVTDKQGNKLPVTSEIFTGSANGSSYYTSAVKLRAKQRTSIELYSPSMNKRATVDLKPRASKNIVWLDILLGFGSGLIVDIPTGNLKMLTPRLIDVQSALEGKPRKQWLSQGKLKRMAKRRANHGR